MRKDPIWSPNLGGRGWRSAGEHAPGWLARDAARHEQRADEPEVRHALARLGVRPGNGGERGERAGERERQAQRRPTRCGARDARRVLDAAGGRSEQTSGSAAAAALPRIVRRSRYHYPDGLLKMRISRPRSMPPAAGEITSHTRSGAGVKAGVLGEGWHPLSSPAHGERAGRPGASASRPGPSRRRGDDEEARQCRSGAAASGTAPGPSRRSRRNAGSPSSRRR